MVKTKIALKSFLTMVLRSDLFPRFPIGLQKDGVEKNRKKSIYYERVKYSILFSTTFFVNLETAANIFGTNLTCAFFYKSF